MTPPSGTGRLTDLTSTIESLPMVSHLYKSFLEDSEEYKESEDFWERLCSDVIRDHSPVKDWKSWLTTSFVDGTPFRDGNPICNLMSPSTHKGVRVIQEAVSSSDVVISAFTDTFGHEPDEEGYVHELVIVCELSTESADIARRLVAEWVRTKEVDDDFGRVIAAMLPQSNDQG